MVKIDKPKTMKVKGSIGWKEAVVLLDSGATHNFISGQVVKELGILVRPAKFLVILGADARVGGSGKSKDVKVSIHRIKINQDFFPLRLGGIASS